MAADRRRLRLLPIGGVLLVLAVGVVLIATDHWRRGAVAFGAAAALAALLRLVLPEPAQGVLNVRSKTFDVLFLLVLVALLAVAVLHS